MRWMRRLRMLHGGDLAVALWATLAVGCSSVDSSDEGGRGDDSPVHGGQTGALMPACGLTDALRRGEGIPAGDGGIVIRVDGCALDFDAAGLTLTDDAGQLIELDVERLDANTVLLRPRVMLAPGSYTLDGEQLGPTPVRVEAEAELPSVLGTFTPMGPGCDPPILFEADPSVLPYLAQLRLSVRVDGGPEAIWFDYGELDLTDGSAELTFAECLGGCVDDGVHAVEVIGEIAGELGTLEPVPVDVDIDCLGADGSWASCRALPRGGTDTPGAGLVIALGLLWWRRRRRAAPT